MFLVCPPYQHAKWRVLDLGCFYNTQHVIIVLIQRVHLQHTNYHYTVLMCRQRFKKHTQECSKNTLDL